jgi:hypothetical protein
VSMSGRAWVLGPPPVGGRIITHRACLVMPRLPTSGELVAGSSAAEQVVRNHEEGTFGAATGLEAIRTMTA